MTGFPQKKKRKDISIFQIFFSEIGIIGIILVIRTVIAIGVTARILDRTRMFRRYGDYIMKVANRMRNWKVILF